MGKETNKYDSKLFKISETKYVLLLLIYIKTNLNYEIIISTFS